MIDCFGNYKAQFAFSFSFLIFTNVVSFLTACGNKNKWRKNIESEMISTICHRSVIINNEKTEQNFQWELSISLHYTHHMLLFYCRIRTLSICPSWIGDDDDRRSTTTNRHVESNNKWHNDHSCPHVSSFLFFFFSFKVQNDIIATTEHKYTVICASCSCSSKRIVHTCKHIRISTIDFSCILHFSRSIDGFRF